jgi:hypothetical protein
MENLPSQSDFCLQFEEDGYVKRFASVTSAGSSPSPTVSALRVSCHPAARKFPRELFTSTQCADHEGPRMPPDFVVGQDILGARSNADRVQEYNRRLVDSNSMMVGAGSLILRNAHLLTLYLILHRQVQACGRKSAITVRSILDASLKSR